MPIDPANPFSAPTASLEPPVVAAPIGDLDLAPAFTRFLAVACIEGGLSATSLAVIEFDFAAYTPQHFHTASADTAPELVDETSDE